MADLFLGLNRGASVTNPYAVTAGSSTGATDVELRINLAKSLTRADVYHIVEGLYRYVLDGQADTSLGV